MWVQQGSWQHALRLAAGCAEAAVIVHGIDSPLVLVSPPKLPQPLNSARFTLHTQQHSTEIENLGYLTLCSHPQPAALHTIVYGIGSHLVLGRPLVSSLLLNGYSRLNLNQSRNSAGVWSVPYATQHKVQSHIQGVITWKLKLDRHYGRQRRHANEACSDVQGLPGKIP